MTAVEMRETVRPGGTPTTRALLDLLVRWGVQHLFCCPGSTEAAVLDALVGRDDIELVLVTHESVAVAMAEGAARLTGRPAVAYLHTTVGMANGLAHLADAQLARTPVLVLNGLKASSLPGRDGFTTAVHPTDMVRQHVKRTYTPVSAAEVPGVVDRALRTAVTEPAGPVWVALPQDLLESSDPVQAPPVDELARPGATRPDPVQVARAAELLRGAERPLLVAGGEVARHGAASALAELARRLGAPVLGEDRRDVVRNGFPTDHPSYAGRYGTGHPAVRDADVVLFAGCRVFTEFEAGGPAPLPATAKLVHAHVDAAEIGRLHPVDAALVGHTALVLDDLLAAVGPRSPARSRAEPSHAEVWRGPGPLPSPFPAHHDIAAVAAAVAEGLGPDATVVLDATTATLPLLEALPQQRADQVHSTTSGSLGWGLGFALGAQLARPDLDVVAVLGDGSFQFGMQALATAVRRRIPVTVVVLNNGRYSAVASALHRFGGAATATGTWPGTDITGTDIAAVATGFGVEARRVDGAADVAGALTARPTDRPFLLEIHTGRPA